MKFTPPPPSSKSLILNNLHRLLAVSCCIFLFTALFSTTLSAQNFTGSGGDGSEKKPYLISSRADLDELSAAVNGMIDTGRAFENVYFKVTQDIDMGTTAFTPIGFGLLDSTFIDPNYEPDTFFTDYVRWFAGNFDGNGKIIKNLTATALNEAGLFGCVASVGSIRNVILDDVNISGNYAGALVGYANGSAITDCLVKGGIVKARLSGAEVRVGGLIGQYSSGISMIQNCHTDVTIGTLPDTGYNRVYIGGLIGVNYGAVAGCSSSGDITAEFLRGGRVYIGGLCGFSGSETFPKIENCMTTSNMTVSMEGTSITGTTWGFIGGFVGQGSIITASHCNATGNVVVRGANFGETPTFYIGGFLGIMQGNSDVSNCLRSGNVFIASSAGETRSGGFIGNQSAGIATNSFASGMLDVMSNGTVHCGGFAGTAGGTVESSYTGCAVTCRSIGGNANAGGFVGSMGSTGMIDNCFARGNILVTAGNIRHIGGLIGLQNSTTSYASNCYSTGIATDSAVGGTVYRGGSFGNITAGTNQNIYFDTVTSRTTVAVGSGSDAGITGLTTAQMVSTAAAVNDSFVSALNAGGKEWKESLYFFNDGYPILTWQRMVIPNRLAAFVGNYATPDTFNVNGTPFVKKGTKFTATYTDLWPKLGKPAVAKKVGVSPYSIVGVNVDSLLVKGKVLLLNKKAYNTARKTAFTRVILDSDLYTNNFYWDWNEVPVIASVKKTQVGSTLKLYGTQALIEKNRVMVDYSKKAPTYYLVTNVRYASSRPKAWIEFVNPKNGKMSKGSSPVVKETAWVKKLPRAVLDYANSAKLTANDASVLVFKLNKKYAQNTRVDFTLDNGNAPDAVTLKK